MNAFCFFFVIYFLINIAGGFPLGLDWTFKELEAVSLFSKLYYLSISLSLLSSLKSNFLNYFEQLQIPIDHFEQSRGEDRHQGGKTNDHHSYYRPLSLCLFFFFFDL